MRLGRTRREDRAPGEVLYYGTPGLGRSESVFWGEGYVPVAHGSYSVKALDAHGGRDRVGLGRGAGSSGRTGGLRGTSAAWPFRGADGLAVAFVFNSLPEDFRPFFREAGQAILAVAGAVRAWPAPDLFAEARPAATPGA